MQRVEIIRALLTHPRVLILDEPTSVLTPQAVEKLFVVLRRLASEGCSILYISHKLHEIRSLCTACTVLRGGQVTGVCNPAVESNASLSRLMIGSEPPELTHRESQVGASVLRVQGLALPRSEPFGVDLQGIHLDVRAGEVVGIAGVSGNGQKELLYALSGEDTRAAPEMVQIAGREAGRLGPGRRRALACTSCRRSVLDAVPCPAWAWRTTCCSRARPRWAKAAGFAWASCRSRRAPSLRVSTSRPAAPTRRRSRCRAATCRNSSWAARSMPGPSCSSSPSPPGVDVGGRADTRRHPAIARRGLRRAGAQRGVGRIVRDM